MAHGLATDPRFAWTALLLALSVRALVLAYMMSLRSGPDGMGDERWIYLEHIRGSATLGFATPAYMKAQAMWHAPLSYLFWTATLGTVAPSIDAGRIWCLALYLSAALVWTFLARLCFAPGRRLLPLALFFVAPTWHTIEVRSYGLYLLLVLTTTYLALVPLHVRDRSTRRLAFVGLTASSALLPFDHLYGFLAPGVLIVFGMGLAVRRRRLGLAFVACALVALAVNVPWVRTLAHERHRKLPEVWAAEAAARADAAAQGALDPANVDENSVNAFSPVLALEGEAKKVGVTDAAIVVLGLIALSQWIQRGATPLVKTIVALLFVVWLRNTFAQLTALAWLARRGRDWRAWKPEWLLVLLLGCLPAAFLYPAFYDNYLTGYRVLPFLLLADILSEPRWDWPARIALLHVVGSTLQLVHWITADPYRGWMPS